MLDHRTVFHRDTCLRMTEGKKSWQQRTTLRSPCLVCSCVAFTQLPDSFRMNKKEPSVLYIQKPTEYPACQRDFHFWRQGFLCTFFFVSYHHSVVAAAHSNKFSLPASVCSRAGPFLWGKEMRPQAHDLYF